jgi:hypothetical protein
MSCQPLYKRPCVERRGEVVKRGEPNFFATHVRCVTLGPHNVTWPACAANDTDSPRSIRWCLPSGGPGLLRCDLLHVIGAMKAGRLRGCSSSSAPALSLCLLHRSKS